MKVVFLITFLLVTAHCAPVQEFHPAILYHQFLHWKQLQRLYKLLNNCRKPPMNSRTTMVPTPPFPPITEIAPPLTSNPPVPPTPDRRGDSLFTKF
ncbi:endotoxic shock protective protein U9-ORF-like [Equus przewalskii]|uniref:Endotoxic shock protective protein U9-ORF-like n=1 Tax=Equus przewalskii TaxID=9798 RepID=A0ABM4P2K9_EQUPR